MLAPRHRLRCDRIARHQRIGLLSVFGTITLKLQELAGLLARGPVVAFGFFQIPSLGRNAAQHAVTIFALIGDGTDRGTTIKLIDPAAAINPFSTDWQQIRATGVRHHLSCVVLSRRKIFLENESHDDQEAAATPTARKRDRSASMTNAR
jgi:hypothetical protein